MAYVSFNRPADTTAYASGDLVANSTTAGSVLPLTLEVARAAGGNQLVRRVRMRKSGTGITNAAFRVHFYAALPTVTNGDNGVWLSAGSANYLGFADVTIDKAFSDGAVGVAAPAADVLFNGGTGLFALVEARGAYTPVSGETIAVDVDLLAI